MVTMTAVKPVEGKTEILPYPELPQAPEKAIGFCPLIGNPSKRFPPDMPKRVQKEIEKAVPVFGMTIKVFYPEKIEGPLSWHNRPLWGTKGDPLVIGERDGRFYLIAAWE